MTIYLNVTFYESVNPDFNTVCIQFENPKELVRAACIAIDHMRYKGIPEDSSPKMALFDESGAFNFKKGFLVIHHAIIEGVARWEFAIINGVVAEEENKFSAFIPDNHTTYVSKLSPRLPISFYHADIDSRTDAYLLPVDINGGLQDWWVAPKKFFEETNASARSRVGKLIRFWKIDEMSRQDAVSLLTEITTITDDVDPNNPTLMNKVCDFVTASHGSGKLFTIYVLVQEASWDGSGTGHVEIVEHNPSKTDKDHLEGKYGKWLSFDETGSIIPPLLS